MNKKIFHVDTVIFDLDGTLVDTAPDLCAAMNHVLEDLRRPHLELQAVRHMVGHGVRKLIEAGLKATGGIPKDRDMDAEQALFLTHYRHNIARLSQPFPGAMDLIKRLKDNDIALGLCTNKPQDLTLRLLDALDLHPYFSSIIGGDALPHCKPHPMHINQVLHELGAQSDALMVGDTQTDVDAARASDIPVAVVSFGYSARPAIELGADGVAESFAHLSQMIKIKTHRKTRR
ncbi:phosphoglycolate phosphatase, bacterial [Iodidimonas muriae]|uniref:phosphoglycolate phosphatase n=1 Tax=Iodidimonas muriae TaxID=261467 RepID=A0ABQ2L6Y3_9PROT|nr:HAD-IA family hydrolase [Iodidimonas muriae]GER06511.1 phosphoglycolate phosphatase, bacterial [Kordiimonadales bacterium JCM 17843]GGO05096.1 phosphoglycolate phosphatase, bacterial [Iodidimonas muriae]